MGVIVGFNRRRDSYQVPLAFAEAGLLDRFVTDYYHPDRWPAVPVVSTRRRPGLPSRLVAVAPAALARSAGWEVLSRLRSKNARFPSERVDSALGRRIATIAARSPASSLLVYSGYALEAFRQRSNAERTLFQYHPAASLLAAVLQSDELRDLRPWLPEIESVSAALEARSADERAAATSFIVASSVTKRSLVLEGVDPARIRVVPYGADVDEAAPPPLAPLPACRFLYVGQGVQRKGLHLLLEAWRRARPVGARLTVVALRVDPEIREMLAGLDGVVVRPGVSATDLIQEFDRTDTLVLPSLLEGFGLVLLEALARGCRLVGSDNTGLPDLDLPAEVARVVRAGSVADLEGALQRAVDSFEPERPYAAVAWRAAQNRSWARFRSELRAAQLQGGA